jgi:hypothetical protein
VKKVLGGLLQVEAFYIFKARGVTNLTVEVLPTCGASPLKSAV